MSRKTLGIFLLLLIVLTPFSLASDPPLAMQDYPLHCATWIGDVTQVEILVAQNPKLIHARDYSESTPLLVAARKGHKELVKFFLDQGASVNAKDDIGWNALTIAVDHHYEDLEEIVKILLDYGIDVNSKDIGKSTPLHRAASVSNATVVQLLIDHGADVNARDEQTTPLEEAAGQGELSEATTALKIMKLLLDAGADPNSQAWMGMSALSRAISDNNKSAVEMLLDHGADPNGEGMFSPGPPLHSALVFSNTAARDIVYLLINRGADINSISKNGVSTLQYAIMANDVELVRFLLSKGAKINIRGWQGKNELELAMEKGNQEIIKLLKDQGAKIGASEPLPPVQQKELVRQRRFMRMIEFSFYIIPTLIVLLLYRIDWPIKKIFRASDSSTDIIRLILAVPVFAVYLFWVVLETALINDSEDITGCYMFLDWLLIIGLALVLLLHRRYFWTVCGLGIFLALIFFMSIGPLPYPHYYNWHFRPAMYTDQARLMNSFVLYFYHLSLVGIILACAGFIRWNVKPIYRLLILLGYRYIAMIAMGYFGW